MKSTIVKRFIIDEDELASIIRTHLINLDKDKPVFDGLNPIDLYVDKMELVKRDNCQFAIIDFELKEEEYI